MLYINHFGKIFLSLLLFLSVNAFAQQSATEYAQLTALKRQIELMQGTIATNNRIIEPHSRYYFDYSRLNADLERVKAGINDYLVPKRAQPRDLVELRGSYLLEGKP